MKYHLVVQPVPTDPKPSRPHTLRIQLVEHGDYVDNWFPRPRAAIEARFKQGAKCFIAFNEDQPLACLWLKANGDFFEDTVRCCFRPLPVESTAWDFDVFVHPEYRLGRTFLHLWNHVSEWMRQNDIDWTMSRIDAFNLASINSHKRLGAQITDSITFWTWGSIQLTLSSKSPRFTLSRRSTPIFTIERPSD
ncbi:MAG: N-acetyltransferase family protein [Gammaproteobacteria bacterium]